MSRIERFTYFERVVHWTLGLSFVYLLLTGLAFSHPRLFWITVLSGGGQTARFLHPWIGVLFSMSLGIMFFIWAKDMRLEGNDRAWLKAIRAYATRQKDGVPPAGKYNAGQKLFFSATEAGDTLFIYKKRTDLVLVTKALHYLGRTCVLKYSNRNPQLNLASIHHAAQTIS